MLKRELELTICRRTTYFIIKGSGYGKWKAQKSPKLTPEVARKRYEWALEYEDYTYDDWCKVIWSDECSVEVRSGHRDKWCLRLNLHGEKWKKKYIQPKEGKGARIMAWAAFWGENHSDLLRLERDFEAKKKGYFAQSYLWILEEMLPSLWEPGLIFMQDNAPIHSPKKVKKWFEDNNISVAEWPPYLPDLNPIEHLRFSLKEGANKLNPDLDTQPGGNETKEDILWKLLEASWAQIRTDILKSLIKSMDYRVNAVLEANGWYTRFWIRI